MAATMSTTIDLPAAGGSVRAKLTLGPIERDGDFGSWRNATVTIGSQSWGVGGVRILDAADAAELNRQRGLQPEAHPNMDWPGAAYPGDVVPYAIGCRFVADDDDVATVPANYDECGEIRPLLEHIGFPHATAAEWNAVATIITDAVIELSRGTDDARSAVANACDC